MAVAPGCAFGPRVLEKTHGPYAESVRQVDEEQLLRNIVHLRYNESPLDLDVSGIAAQYELSTGAEARPFFLAPNPSNSNVIFKTFTSILPALSVSGSNRPTVTMVPQTDGSATRRFLTPINFDTLVFLSQTSWPVSTVFRLWAERINGVPNAVAAGGSARDEVPDFARFRRVTELMDETQKRELATIRAEERAVEVGGPFPAAAVTAAAAVEAARAGLEYRPKPGGTEWVLTRKERRLHVEVSPGAENSPELAELEGLLNLAPGRKAYDVSLTSRGAPDPARFPGAPAEEFKVVPRSTAQVMAYLANGVEVPPEHVFAGLVRPQLDAAGRVFDDREVTRGLFEVRVSKGHKPPPCAYVAVCYRGYWYYIDDRDADSKATFALVLQVSRLDFARQTLGAAPTLTLPAGR
jgi:hypothetical protein